MKKKIIIGALIVIAFIFLFSINIINSVMEGKQEYEAAESLFLSGNYYETFTKYYKDFSGEYKTNLENLLIQEIANKTWKTDIESNYTNFNNCLGYEKVVISDNVINHSVVCGEDEYPYANRATGKSKLELWDYTKYSDHIIFNLTYSDSLYLFIDDDNNIYIQGGALEKIKNPYTGKEEYGDITYRKFSVFEE